MRERSCSWATAHSDPSDAGGRSPLKGVGGAFVGPASVPMLLPRSVHPARQPGLETPDGSRTDPFVNVGQYLDAFGNICRQVVAPPGRFTLSAAFVIRDTGLVDEYAPG